MTQGAMKLDHQLFSSEISSAENNENYENSTIKIKTVLRKPWLEHRYHIPSMIKPPNFRPHNKFFFVSNISNYGIGVLKKQTFFIDIK